MWTEARLWVLTLWSGVPMLCMPLLVVVLADTVACAPSSLAGSQRAKQPQPEPRQSLHRTRGRNRRKKKRGYVCVSVKAAAAAAVAHGTPFADASRVVLCRVVLCCAVLCCAVRCCCTCLDRYGKANIVTSPLVQRTHSGGRRHGLWRGDSLSSVRSTDSFSSAGSSRRYVASC